MGLLQTKNFSIAKETISKMKRPPAEWDKIFANNISDKGLIPKIYKNSYNSISRTQTTQF